MKSVAAFLASVVAAFGGASATSTPTAQIVQGTHCATITHYLAYGTSGPEVSQLQKYLGVSQTGYFGPLTQSTLIKWQISAGIIPSAKSDGAGAVGPKTRGALRCIEQASVQSTASTVVQSDHSKDATSSVATSEPQITAPISLPAVSTGGGGGTAKPRCPAFTTPKPPASQCKTGPWVVISDEANCPVQWDCSDPNSIE